MARFHFAAPGEAQNVLLRCTTGYVQMLRHSTEVIASNAPVLIDAPDWYGDFVGAWSGIATRARTWSDAIAPQISVIPQMLADFGTSYRAAFDAAQALLDRLAAQPNDTQARAALKKEIDELLRQAKANVPVVNSLRSQLGELANHVGPDRETLATAVASAESSVRADLQQINDISNRTSELKTKIKDLEVKLGLMSFVAVDALVVMVGATYLVTIAGGEALYVTAGVAFTIIGAVGASLATYKAIMLRQEISDLQNQIAFDAAKMSRLNSQVLHLKVFDQTVTDLVNVTADSSSVMADVSAAWSVLAADTQALQADLENAEKDLDAGAIAGLRKDLQAGADHWAQVQPLAAGLAAITVTVDSQPRSADGEPLSTSP